MPGRRGEGWLAAFRRYLAVTAVGHLLWETVQLPLYSLWRDGTPGEVAFAIVHCTAGDLLIALASLTAALMLVGRTDWPSARFGEVAALTLSFGLAYTVYSEWINTSVRGTWAYTSAMPVLPPLGTGLAPAMQWVLVPLLALGATRWPTRDKFSQP